MKSLTTSFLIVFSLVAVQSGCERHSASKTIPGYAEKMEKKDEAAKNQATHSETADAQAPAYFPPKN
ncbi:MAG: hypothetical protein CAK90_01710 [Spartobacteria bacterium AMD-G4]|jgi:hypothetical protein|nr:MAG: hypothetical protein CAK90_01710 [Spartobacteria bacterium AMD-G4]